MGTRVSATWPFGRLFRVARIGRLTVFRSSQEMCDGACFIPANLLSMPRIHAR
jgi:hypothetical protein